MFSDLKFTIRTLLKTRGLTVAVLATLALCIGANTAIFSMLYALIIKPLPFPEPQRMVEVNNSFTKLGLNDWPSNVVQYLDFKEHAPAFSALGLWQLDELTLGEAGHLSRLMGATATAEMFEVFSIKPLLGRFFSAENHRPATGKVLVLTEAFWKSHFNGDAGVLGKSVRLNGERFEIVGVAPSALQAFDARIKFIRPMAWVDEEADPGRRYGVYCSLYGRLKPNASLSTAHAQIVALEKAFYDAAPVPAREFLDRSGHIISVNALQKQRTKFIKTELYLLQGGVLFVLLIGCLNVANLLLARANTQQNEFVIRVALGAERGRIARQLFMESAALCWTGAALGLALAWAAVRVINYFTAQMLPHALPFQIDGRVLGYAAATAIVMSLVIGLLPITQILGDRLSRSMQSQARGASADRGVRAISGALVVVQMAVALMLLSGAGLLIRSLANAVAVDPGFDPRHLISGRIALPAGYLQDNRAQLFQRRLQAALQDLPGTTAAVTTSTPFQTGTPSLALKIRDHMLAENASPPNAFFVGASPTYLQAMRIPLREGRWFRETDTDKSRPVYVVDEDFAQRFFPGRSAVGQHLTFMAPPAKLEDWPEIIGVVGNVRHNGVEERSGNPYVYFPMTQAPAPLMGGLSIMARTTRPMPEVFALLRQKIAALDSALPIFQVSLMESIISDSFNNRRGIVLLLASFAGLALLLSAIGIYGVLAYSVSQRTREIGIRSAVGATARQIVLLILGNGLWKTALGLVIGLVGTVTLSRFMTCLLYDVEPTDPWVYLLVSLLLLTVALWASYLPARRATRVDPLVALRAE